MPEPALVSETPPIAPWRLFCWIAAAAICAAVAVYSAAFWIWHRVEPNAREMVVHSLEHRMHCKVEIDRLNVSLHHGIEVDGSGLRIESLDGQSHPAATGVPMLTVAGFHFKTTLLTLIFQHPSAVTAYVRGVTVTVPPAPYTAANRQSGFNPQSSVLTIASLIATDAKLVLESGIASRPPTEFDFERITLTNMGTGKPFAFDADVAEPSPFNKVHATGHLGPWVADRPRQTPIDTSFSFGLIDISYVRGLNGHMSVTSAASGSLGRLSGRGAVDIPDFALDISAHPFALHTDLQLSIDNTTGEIAFAPATARLLHTTLTATGTLSQTTGIPGHDAELTLAIDHGRLEDTFTLLSKSEPPLQRGELRFSGKLSVPPGTESVLVKSTLVGTASVTDAIWEDAALQQMSDSLSLRARGHAREAKASPLRTVPAAVSAHIALRGGTVHLTDLVATMPGASIVMNGTYPLLASDLELHGVARTAAPASELTSGWKSLLLRPLDPLLRKDGAGAEIPVKLTGDKSSPKFGLDLANRRQDRVKTEQIPTTERK